MPVTEVGSEAVANRLFEALVGPVNANLPDVNLFDLSHTIPWDQNSEVFKPVEKVTVEQLTEYFNQILEAFKGPLEEQYVKSRITGADYAKTYVALSQTAMQSAVQFALGKDQAFWLAAKTQADALTAQNQNELVRIQAMTSRVNFALTKLQLASEDSKYGTSELQRLEVLPAQVSLVQEQTKLAVEQTEASRAQTHDQRLSDGLSVSGVLGGQKLLTQEQRTLVHEQMEGQRAQTLDSRADGAERGHNVANPDGSTEQRLQGLLGVQNFLYRQQIHSYREDVKAKAAKIFADLWITQKTIDEGVQPSDYFRPPTTGNSTPLDGIFKAVRKSAMGTEPDTFIP